jgi:20S proteasome alpha/beta subunit
MTAIFAYAEDDTAFIGADTRRAVLELSSVVTKIHRWSEHILLAQTGAGKPMTELIYAMMVTRFC